MRMNMKPLKMHRLKWDRHLMYDCFDRASVLIAWNVAMACAGFQCKGRDQELRDLPAIKKIFKGVIVHWGDYETRWRTVEKGQLLQIMKALYDPDDHAPLPSHLSSHILLDVTSLLRCSLIFDASARTQNGNESLHNLLYRDYCLSEMESAAQAERLVLFFDWLEKCVESMDKTGTSSNMRMRRYYKNALERRKERYLEIRSCEAEYKAFASPQGKPNNALALRDILTSCKLLMEDIRRTEGFLTPLCGSMADPNDVQLGTYIDSLGADELGKMEYASDQILCELQDMTFGKMRSQYNWLATEDDQSVPQKRKIPEALMDDTVPGSDDVHTSDNTKRADTVDLDHILEDFRIPRSAYGLYVCVDDVSQRNIQLAGGMAQTCDMQLSLCYGFLHARKMYLDRGNRISRVGHRFHVNADYSACWDTLLALSVWVIVQGDKRAGAKQSLILSRIQCKKTGAHQLDYSVSGLCRFSDLYSMENGEAPSPCIFRAAAKLVNRRYGFHCRETDVKMISLGYESAEGQVVVCFAAFVRTDNATERLPDHCIALPYRQHVIAHVTGSQYAWEPGARMTLAHRLLKRDTLQQNLNGNGKEA